MIRNASSALLIIAPTLFVSAMVRAFAAPAMLIARPVALVLLIVPEFMIVSGVAVVDIVAASALVSVAPLATD
ncbi:hypothetical protein [uncultured Sphingomonas sp.]|uniref:hypothetical protein n=1 Tax=uncultured Sphingomonas sp. TaxID=158754 RepID=UPI0035CAE071